MTAISPRCDGAVSLPPQIIVGELREGFGLWCPERREWWPLTQEIFRSFLDDKFFLGRWIGRHPKDTETLEETLRIIAIRDHNRGLTVFKPRAWRALETCYANISSEGEETTDMGAPRALRAV